MRGFEHEMGAQKKKGGKHAANLGTSGNEAAPWGHGEYANMPQEVIMEDYPSYMPEPNNMDSIDDTITRLVSDNKEEKRGVRKNLDRGMY